MENNFFDFATKETTQDTFVAWLINNINQNKDTEEYKIAKCFLESIIKKIDDKINMKKINTVRVEMQKCIDQNRLDILVTVNNEYRIIFEDKFYSMEFEGQINKYIMAVKNEFKLDNTDKILVVYYKMLMTQYEKEKIKEKFKNEVKIIDRVEMSEILKFYNGENIIIRSYIKWLENIREQVKESEEKDFNKTLSDNNDKKWIKKAIYFKLFDHISEKFKNETLYENYQGKEDSIATFIFSKKEDNSNKKIENICVVITDVGKIELWYVVYNIEEMKSKERERVKENLQKQYNEIFVEKLKNTSNTLKSDVKAVNGYIDLYIGTIKDFSKSTKSLNEIKDEIIKKIEELKKNKDKFDFDFK